jgi:hypothetical protein
MIRNTKKEKLTMNTKERSEIRKEYIDKLQYTEKPKELIKIGTRKLINLK